MGGISKKLAEYRNISEEARKREPVLTRPDKGQTAEEAVKASIEKNREALKELARR